MKHKLFHYIIISAIHAICYIYNTNDEVIKKPLLQFKLVFTFLIYFNMTKLQIYKYSTYKSDKNKIRVVVFALLICTYLYIWIMMNRFCTGKEIVIYIYIYIYI